MTKTIRCGDRVFVAGEKTLIMGVLNVTPDSFSDGGETLQVDDAVRCAKAMIQQGADIIDVGAVSTAPGVTLVDEDEELCRILTVIKALNVCGITNISIDTMRSRVAEEGLAGGASWINDQSAGLFDPRMASVMTKADAVVLMHNGKPQHSGVEAGETVVYSDVLEQLSAFFAERIAQLSLQGVSKDKVIVDPGVGFGKGLSDSLTIINNMDRFDGLGVMSLIGLSRKSFIKKITGIETPKDRDNASLGAHAAAIYSGANIIRTHNVRASVEMTRVLDHCLAAKKNLGESL